MEAYRADVAFDGERVMTGGALVLVRDGVIAGVESASAAVPGGCPVTHLPGTTLLPGLIDTHTHLCGNDQFDALDRLITLTAPAPFSALVTELHFDANGNRARVTRTNGDDPVDGLRTTQYQYSPRNQLRFVFDDLGHATEFAQRVGPSGPRPLLAGVVADQLGRERDDLVPSGCRHREFQAHGEGGRGG